MNTIPRSYQDLLEQARTYSHQQVIPAISSLLQDFDIVDSIPQSQSPLFYVLDYVNKKYLHIAPSVAPILGYDQKQLIESGPDFYMNLWHPEDFSVYSNHVVPATLSFLKEKSNITNALYAITHNHRIKNVYGNWLVLLQRSSYIRSANGDIIGAYGFSIDITHYKENTSIIHTIERIDANFNPIEKEPSYKMVYYPDGCVFSVREMQILQALYKGQSSKQIATQLSLSPYTVHNHRKKLLTKSNTTNTAELISYAVKQGLL